MIGIIFDFAGSYVEVRVNGYNLTFRTNQTGGMFAPFEGLQLSRSGVIKEFPDLENREDWKDEAIKRFKEKIKTMKSEDEITEYIISDLKKFGYKPYVKQKQGFRTVRIDG